MIEALFALAGVVAGAGAMAYRLKGDGETTLRAIVRGLAGGGPGKTPPR